MKKELFAIAVLAFILTTAHAQSSGELFREAGRAYSEARYSEAVELYHRLIDEGYDDATIYYNLGNAYFKQGALGESILSFERAYRLEPSDPDIIQNLNVARARTRDRVDAIPLLFAVQWWNDLKTEHSLAALLAYSVTLLWLLAACVFVFFGLHNVYIRRASLAAGIVIAGLFLASVFLVQDKNEDLSSGRYAIVLSMEAPVSSAPDRSGVDAFLVHEGLKIEIIGKKGEQMHIRLADGKEGWIEEAHLVRI